MKKILFFILLLLSNELYSQSAEDYYYSGVEKLANDNIGALSDFTKALKIDPNNADVYFIRGRTKWMLDDNIGAISDFTKTIEINPKYSLAYFERGICKGTLEDYRGAIADFTKAIEFDPKNAKAYFYRGFNKLGLATGVNNINQSLNDSACLDLSKAGELGDYGAYDVIKKFCK
nr:hypothetical protein [uncultured Emticicia sp.]